MCGITGYVLGRTLDAERDGRILDDMVASLSHRGPDDHGAWLDASAGVALGHRRLSIIDLSPLGHQPMCSASGRWVISYNGEIYNYRDVRRELTDLGVQFRSASDTEVILNAVEAWGVERALGRCSGMFAIALWDRETRTLTLSRDRLGEKPLYWSVSDDAVFFASELKALKAHPQWRPGLDRQALALYFKHNFVPAPHTIYESTWKLAPGAYVQIRIRGRSVQVKEYRYWDLAAGVQTAAAAPFDRPEAAVEVANQAIENAVARQLVADVPLGAFLSGGIDSSTVVALMQALSARPVRTFTIGFAEQGYDEAPHAQAVARHLGTDHTELYVTLREAMAVVPQLPSLYDEPFADASQIPTFLVSQTRARAQVTVALSGDGGDELFSGYERYRFADRIWRAAGSACRAACAGPPRAGFSASRRAQWDRVLRRTAEPAAGPHAAAASRRQAAQSRRRHRPRQRRRRLRRAGLALATARRRSSSARRTLETQTAAHIADPVRRMMYRDLVGYLPDSVLAKVDRAAMAVESRSARPPARPPPRRVCVHRAAEHPAPRRPSKWPLRRVLERYVPQTLTQRPKMGFGVPINSWLRGELRDWAEGLIDDAG